MGKKKRRNKGIIPNQTIEASRINRSVTEVDYPEDNLYRVGFKHYEPKKGSMDGAKASELKKIFEFLGVIGKCRNHLEMVGPAKKIAQEIKPVTASNDYLKYFSGLTSDVDLKEFDVGQLRAFFFFEHPIKTLQLVAIDHHPEDKKNRR